MPKIRRPLAVLPGIFLALLPALFSCRAQSPGPPPERTGPSSEAGPGRTVIRDAVHDEIAKFLAGLPSDSESYRPLRETAAWSDYAREIETNWAETEETRLRPMAVWAETELAAPDGSAEVVFYPFGGPDFVTVYRLFPKAETYILLGLERVGSLPVLLPMSPLRVEAYLSLMKAALADFFKRSYFITDHMDDSLPHLDGVLPVIAFFLARSGGSVVSVRRVDFGPDGGLLETAFRSPDENASRPRGVRIDFSVEGADGVQTLFYFSKDLENKVFTPETPLHRHLDGLSEATTFIKSASYLLHYENFSRIRDLILAKSRRILQDDSGIPFRHFRDGWRVRLFGVYEKPIKDFLIGEQADLAAAFRVPEAAEPLPFNLGYHWWARKDNLLLIRRE